MYPTSPRLTSREKPVPARGRHVVVSMKNTEEEISLTAASLRPSPSKRTSGGVSPCLRFSRARHVNTTVPSNLSCPPKPSGSVRRVQPTHMCGNNSSANRLWGQYKPLRICRTNGGISVRSTNNQTKQAHRQPKPPSMCCLPAAG